MSSWEEYKKKYEENSNRSWNNYKKQYEQRNSQINRKNANEFVSKLPMNNEITPVKAERKQSLWDTVQNIANRTRNKIYCRKNRSRSFIRNSRNSTRCIN